MSDKAIKRCKTEIKERIKNIQKAPTSDNATKYNATILGMHQYYKVATGISLDFKNIAFSLNKSLKSRTKQKRNSKGIKSKAFMRYYGDFKGEIIYIQSIALFPISKVKTKPPKCFCQETCNYTTIGRIKIHDNLKTIDTRTLKYIMENPITSENTEFNDNRISLYVGQTGKCGVTGKTLKIGNMEVHHKTPKVKGGKSEYNNLIYVTTNIHKLIHATTEETIKKYLEKEKLNENQMSKLNKLRKIVGNCELKY